jgi:hypothetical protein
VIVGDQHSQAPRTIRAVLTIGHLATTGTSAATLVP